MKIWVSSLSRVHDTAATARPASVVSLLSPGDVFPTIDDLHPDEHHKVHLHDIREPQDGMVAPGEEHVERVIGFLRGWSPEAPLLVHCWAGVSRSTATAFIAACIHNPETPEDVIAEALAAASPTAYPNTRIAAIADRALGRSGRLSAAVEKLCSDEERRHRAASCIESTPFSIPSRY